MIRVSRVPLPAEHGRITEHELLDRLDGVREQGEGWIARCPAHDDRRQSLSVDTGPDGIWLMCCHAGCSFLEIADALGIPPAMMFPHASDRQHGARLLARMRPERMPREPLPSEARLQGWQRNLFRGSEAMGLAWRYKQWTRHNLLALDIGWDGSAFTLPVRGDEDELLTVMRYRPGADPKMLPMVAGYGRHLYPFPPDGTEPGPVWLVEGEPDAISAREMGLDAFAVPGVNGWRKEWASRFEALRVVVCMDPDPAGQKAASRICCDLHDAGVEAWSQWLDPAIGDLGDYVAKGVKLP